MNDASKDLQPTTSLSPCSYKGVDAIKLEIIGQLNHRKIL